MSEPKKKQKAAPPKLETITLPEMREMWPVSDEGRLCARLLQRYGFTVLVETSLGAECSPMTAQAEASANKILARMIHDFGTLALPRVETAPKPMMQTLNRFKATEKPENQTTEKK